MRGSTSHARILIELGLIVGVGQAGALMLMPLLAPSLHTSTFAAFDVALTLLIAGPLTAWRLVAARRRARSGSDTWSLPWRAGATVAAILITGVTATTTAVVFTTGEVHAQAKAKFERLTERLVTDLNRRVNQARFGLAGARGTYAAMGTLRRADFERYVTSRNLPVEFPGTIGFGFIQRVNREDLASFIEAERADGSPGFTVRSLAEPGTALAQAPQLYVIKHCFPASRNGAAWGVDVGSEPNRREAAERAVRTGEPAITDKITLVQDNQGRTGFLYFLPVYKGAIPPQTPEEREASLVGLVYAPIILEESIVGVAEAVEGELDFEIFDGETPTKTSQLYDHDDHLREATGTISSAYFTGRMFERRTAIKVGGRIWSVLTSTTPRFEAAIDRSTPETIGIGGSILSLLAASLALQLLTRHSRAVELAGRMTADLALAKLAAEDALREVAAFRATLDRHSIISVTDRSGRITDVNPPFCAISGYSREELLGQDHRILNSGVHPKEFWVGVWRSLAAGKAWRGEICNRAKDGSLYWVDSIIAPFVGADGTTEKFVSIRNDITARKSVEGELVRAREQAETSNRAKSSFLANMSHEIRTPLTAILGFADLLREEDHSALSTRERAESVEAIRRAGSHLMTVINDILDLSKIEAERMTVEVVETPLPTVLRDVQSLMKPRATGKGIGLEVQLATPVPNVILSDPTRLRQILMNLIGNAVKFTEIGTVRIIARVEHHAGGPRLWIDIEDTGPGMTEAQAANLFQAFAQADETVSRKFGGTGLGLTICRRLSNLMGGSVTLVRTAPGAGSCFRIDLPLSAAPGSSMTSQRESNEETLASAPAAIALRLSGRILLAEDGVDNQRLISFHLRKAGATVDIADNGRIALEKFRAAAAANAPYDLLLTDIQMPEMDGYTLVQTLRTQGSRLPVVALTAHAMPEDQLRCTEAGCDAYASKPIDKLALLETCAKWLRQDALAPSRSGAA